MEPEIEALIRIAEALENGFVPLWFAVIGIGAPIVLTALSIWLNYKTGKQNEELQKNLHNRDVKNQTRQSIIYIYNSFLEALNVAESASNNVMAIFISHQSIQHWSMSVYNSCTSITHAFNQANIILDDSDMIEYLRECKDTFVDLNGSVTRYISTPIPSQMIQNAFDSMKSKYPQRYSVGIIGINDYNFLYPILSQNVADLEDFKKMCENDYTKEIQKKVKIFIDLIANEKFDNYFKKYVQIQKL